MLSKLVPLARVFTMVSALRGPLPAAHTSSTDVEFHAPPPVWGRTHSKLRHPLSPPAQPHPITGCAPLAEAPSPNGCPPFCSEAAVRPLKTPSFPGEHPLGRSPKPNSPRPKPHHCAYPRPPSRQTRRTSIPARRRPAAQPHLSPRLRTLGRSPKPTQVPSLLFRGSG